jgi:hypothetical protein
VLCFSPTSVYSYVRQLLVGWITALDSVPGISMLDWLPELLEGLFDMLSDVNRDIRQQAYAALSDFLDQMCKQPPAAGAGAAEVEAQGRGRWGTMVAVLIAQAS